MSNYKGYTKADSYDAETTEKLKAHYSQASSQPWVKTLPGKAWKNT